MSSIKNPTVQTMKWMALASSYGVFFVGGVIAISWVLFQFLVLMVRNL